MTTFIIRRLLQTVFVVLILSYFCFFIMTLMPGDPVELMIQSNPKITSEDVTRLFFCMAWINQRINVMPTGLHK